jgi:GTP-binding protein
MAFVDRVEIFVKGGEGGNGAVSFRREKHVPKGGPDGGNGGRGGAIILRASESANSLADLSFKRHWKAPSGEHGAHKNQTGSNGEDLVINVPPGTIVKDRDHDFVIKDLGAGSEITIAKGGRGGRGNLSYMSSTNQAPRQHELGHPGEERWIILELKLIADIGIVGLPNAGKSTLLSRLSRAQPEIAAYPFTTKYPNLGILYFDNERHCVMADIPGLIEGAHEGAGLGHEFLRHVERTKGLVHLVDCLPLDGTSPLENYRAIRREMELYSPKLAAKDEIVALSKCELTDVTELRAEMAAALGKPVLAISSATGAGLQELTQALAKQLGIVPDRWEPPPRTVIAK